MTVSAVARLHGVSPSLLFKWRQLMSQGGQVAVKAEEDDVAASKNETINRTPLSAYSSVPRSCSRGAPRQKHLKWSPKPLQFMPRSRTACLLRSTIPPCRG
jgi:transposase-like protein